MSNNVRVRPIGFWTFNSNVLPAEFELIDSQLTGSIAGSGGTYAPSSLLTIGGSGMTVSGPLIASNVTSMSVAGSLNILLGSTLQLFGNQVVNSGSIVGFQGGSFLTMSLGSTFTMNAGSTANIAAATTLSGTNTLSGATTISGALTLSGATTQTAAHTKSGANAYTSLRATQINSALAVDTLSTDADVWWVLTPIAVNVVYTLKSTGPVPPEGTTVTVLCYNVGLGKTVEIRREDASLILTFTTGNGGAEFVVIGNDWKLKNVWGNYTLSSVFA
jgi:hypothetical protein